MTDSTILQTIALPEKNLNVLTDVQETIKGFEKKIGKDTLNGCQNTSNNTNRISTQKNLTDWVASEISKVENRVFYTLQTFPVFFSYWVFGY